MVMMMMILMMMILVMILMTLMMMTHTLSRTQAFNILRYQTGQHYDQHYDYMPEDMYGPIKNNRV